MSNKSEATWHPNSAPEAPHADLIAAIAESKALAEVFGNKTAFGRLYKSAAGALTALGDTVPREQYVATVDERAAWEYVAHTVERERDEARAERDALAHVIEQARRVPIPEGAGSWRDRAAEVETILCAAPAVSLALHDAEVWDEGFDQGVEYEGGQSMDRANPYRANPYRANPYRAAAIREEVK